MSRTCLDCKQYQANGGETQGGREVSESNNNIYVDGKCGNCGSMNVSFNYFDSEGPNKGFQEFTCRDCGATTYQTFVYTITEQEITTTEEE